MGGCGGLNFKYSNMQHRLWHIPLFPIEIFEEKLQKSCILPVPSVMAPGGTI